MQKNTIISIIVLLVVIAVGFYLFGQDDSVVVPEDGEVVVNEQVVKDTETGIQFEYPVGYHLDEVRPTEDFGDNFIKAYILMLESDRQRLQEEEVPTEGPPTISISIFENVNNQQAGMWVEDNPDLSNITLARTETSDTIVGGANAVQYRADGLYASNVAVIAHGGYIFIVAGGYIDEQSPTYQDFNDILESIEFIPAEGQI